jgi:hypothetical protein
MKTLCTAVILIVCHLMLRAQDATYLPVDQQGWEMTNFSVPENLDVKDSGAVNYLLTVNARGKVTNVKAIASSLPSETEKRWRTMTRKLKFQRADGVPKKKFKGTLNITFAPCDLKGAD